MKCIIVTLALFVSSFYCKGLREEFTWSRLSYTLPRSVNHNQESPVNHKKTSNAGEIVFPGSTNGATSESVSDIDLEGSYIFENNIPMGANRWQSKLFITVPRRRAGIPSTLNYIWLNTTNRHNVPLIPYPNWKINQFQSLSEGEHLVSVYRTAVDVCNRLWMVDTGVIEIPGNNTRIQPPGIVIVDLHTDVIIRRYNLKPSDLQPYSTLASLVVDVSPADCSNAFVYIPDLSGYGLIVYSFQENDSWRVTHNYFYLESLAGEFYIGGINFQWNDGVFSLGLSDINEDGYRTIYFHSMAGTHIFSVSTRILKNPELATRSYHQNDFKVVADRGLGSQTSASDLHKPSGVLFLALVNQNAFGCWNIHKPTKPENFDIVHKDDHKLIYPSDVKIYDDQVIVLSNTMPVFLYSQLNYDETNFRVWISNISDAVKDTTCINHKRPSSTPGY